MICFHFEKLLKFNSGLLNEGRFLQALCLDRICPYYSEVEEKNLSWLTVSGHVKWPVIFYNNSAYLLTHMMISFDQ